jgi:arylsulfatase A-like enzyme
MFDPGYEGSVTGDNFYFNPAVNRRMDRRDLEHVLALYDGEIRLVDDHIAKLRAALERLGVAQKTIFVITADHGDEFFEHGRKGHHRTLYDEVLRVPFIVHVPGVEPARGVVAMESSTIDIMPTVLGLVGLPIPPGVEGADLSAVAVRGAPEWERPVLAELYRRDALNVQAAVRRTGKKVIHHFNRRWIEVFDIAADPAESSNLASDQGFAPAMLADMRGLLNGLWPVYQARVARGEVDELTMDEETLNRLKLLGYVEE